ncbi:hypothetical protein PoB_001063800 [Plakobranchus ocellatus]|uniref:Uncharacterized protein n=1 Tax=Plakobranchus ocellatus TaxID=259542 RepID=A0AAV3YP65_9GAST|nr:hypothetical protein PoB_001063800 [Plakobranchus ocellatus]
MGRSRCGRTEREEKVRWQGKRRRQIAFIGVNDDLFFLWASRVDQERYHVYGRAGLARDDSAFKEDLDSTGMIPRSGKSWVHQERYRVYGKTGIVRDDSAFREDLDSAGMILRLRKI